MQWTYAEVWKSSEEIIRFQLHFVKFVPAMSWPLWTAELRDDRERAGDPGEAVAECSSSLIRIYRLEPPRSSTSGSGPLSHLRARAADEWIDDWCSDSSPQLVSEWIWIHKPPRVRGKYYSKDLPAEEWPPPQAGRSRLRFLHFGNDRGASRKGVLNCPEGD